MSRGSAFVFIASLLGLAAPSVASQPGWSSQFAQGIVFPSARDGATCMQAHAGPNGWKLYIGGEFQSAGGVESANLVAFNGRTFQAIPGAGWDSVASMTVFPIGGVPRVVVAGLFKAPETQDGLAWIDDEGSLNALPDAPFSHAWFGGVFGWMSPAGPELLLSSGLFPFPGSEYIYRYTPGGGFSSVGVGVISVARSYAVFDDGTGPAVFMNMPMVGAASIQTISKWDGTTLTSVTPGNASFGAELCVHNDATGDAIYVAGSGVRRLRSAAAGWEMVPGGPANQVEAIASFDDGTGPALYVAGSFTSVNGQSMARIARWKGGTWEPLGTGITGGPVAALHVFDEDGPGPRAAGLFAVGKFTTAGGVPSMGIARWGRASCTVDVDGDDAATVQDIFGFLNAWFLSQPAADHDLSGSITSQDIFAYLNAWFAGC